MGTLDRGIMGTQRAIETQGNGDTQPWGHGDVGCEVTGSWGHTAMGLWGHRDMGTRGHTMGTRGHGAVGTRRPLAARHDPRAPQKSCGGRSRGEARPSSIGCPPCPSHPPSPHWLTSRL